LTDDKDLLEKLEKLAKLKQEGVLTDDEFQKLKSQILKELSNQISNVKKQQKTHEKNGFVGDGQAETSFF
jgi:ElaB/YqjD/DUF883 family membrane-anchored ribosome-binding protein